MKKLLGIFGLAMCLLLFFVKNLYAACSPEESANPKNICYYRTDYKTLSSSLTLPNQIQQFSGDLVTAEFDESPDPTTGLNRYYAGHIGSFWSPPYFSSHEMYSGSGSNPAWQRKSFLTSLVFYNRDCHCGRWEEISDMATEAFWYPSKMEVSKFYGGGGGGTQIRGVKMALPKRSLALKITETSQTPLPNNPNLLFLIGVDTLGKLDSWNRTTQDGWNWGAKMSYNNSTSSETVRAGFDAANKIFIFNNPVNGVYLGAGLDNASVGKMQWELADSIDGTNAFHYRFKNTGILNNANNETTAPGAYGGLSVVIPTLATNQSYTATLLVAVGGSASEVTQRIQELRGMVDIEQYADNLWNQRLSSVLNNLPALETTNNEVLKKIYYNSELSYLLNRWDSFDSMGSISFYGVATGFFPWTTGTEEAFILSNPEFWKNMLKKLLTMDYSQCMAYQPLNHTSRTQNLDRCFAYYSYSIYSLVDQIYAYVALTGDKSFLDEVVDGKKVIDWVQSLSLFKEAGNEGKLVDFGNDHNLYEYDIHCPSDDPNVPRTLAGRYTGYVVSPNSERLLAITQTAELLSLRGDKNASDQFESRATGVKTAIQTLWNPGATWFDTINLWGPDLQKRAQPMRETFPAVAVFNTLDVPGLLSDGQKQSLLNKIASDEWIDSGTLRFSSLPRSMSSQWCPRTDWHGPGLYSGEIGQMLTRMFSNGFKEKAAQVLFATPGKGYSFLARIPISHQAYAVADQTFRGGQNSAYYEGISFVQSIINGVAGIDPAPGKMRFRPRLPSSLGFPFSLKNISLQKFLMEFTATDKTHIALSFSPKAGQDYLSFDYSPDDGGHTIALTVSQLPPQTKYTVEVFPKDNSPKQAYSQNTDSGGNLKMTFVISKDAYISVSAFQTILGDMNNDGRVDIGDIRFLFSSFTNIFDYNKIVENFGK